MITIINKTTVLLNYAYVNRIPYNAVFLICIVWHNFCQIKFDYNISVRSEIGHFSSKLLKILDFHNTKDSLLILYEYNKYIIIINWEITELLYLYAKEKFVLTTIIFYGYRVRWVKIVSLSNLYYLGFIFLPLMFRYMSRKHFCRAICLVSIISFGIAGLNLAMMKDRQPDV